MKNIIFGMILVMSLIGCESSCPITTCCDGTCSNSTGLGTCSGHRGVCDANDTHSSKHVHPYNVCETAGNCTESLSDVCITLTQVWTHNFITTNSICTSKVCNPSNEESCDVGRNGIIGYCSYNSILGAPPNTCFERCSNDDDCPLNFVCTGSDNVVGLEVNEYICVPQ